MKNKVSIWIGNFKNRDELIKYTNIEYTEEGDSIPSFFEKDFRLDYYDRDLVEKSFISIPTDNIKELLADFSYSESFSKELHINKQEYNTAILIYEYEYDGREKSIKHNQNELEFIGAIEYQAVVDDRW